jgi:hypothetical protein
VVDHVVIGVRDLDAAAATLATTYGLVTVEGGRHPGWGTANRLVPLGPAYLELVTVVDEAEAAASDFGRWVLAMLDGRAAMGWAARTGYIDAWAARFGVEVAEGSRLSSDGTTLRWRIAGVSRAAADPPLPFLISWGAGTPLPGTRPVEHAVGAVRLHALHLAGDLTGVTAVLGRAPEATQPGDELPLVADRSAPDSATAGVTAVELVTPAGHVLLVGGL